MMHLSCPRPQRKPRRDNSPYCVHHPSFDEPGADGRYGSAPQAAAADSPYMPDEVTRDHARRMHYAAHRWNKGGDAVWLRRYYALRNAISAGNLKLVYRAVERLKTAPGRTDDLIGEGQLVLIRAVEAYNPWLGVRFSSYAFTCLMRALVRLVRRQAADRLASSLLLDQVGELALASPDEPPYTASELGRFLTDAHPLLSPREKLVLARRFPLGEMARPATLDQIGQEVGMSKERVRQVQLSALAKLRGALACPAAC